MYNLHLSAEQLEIRDTVRDFVAQEIKPVALKAERLDACDRSLLADVLDQASQMGLRTLALSEELGGAGADALTCCIVTEELAVGDADIAAVLVETSALGGVLFARMTPAQRERFLPPFLDDDRYHLALAATSPATDTALGVNYHRPTAIDAEPQDDGRARRRRMGHQRRPRTASPTRRSPSCSPSRSRSTDRRRHAAGAARYARPDRARAAARPALVSRRLRRGDVQGLPRAGRQSAARRGAAARRCGRARRPAFAAMNLGIGRAAYEAALDYAQLRVQGGRRIVEHQAIGDEARRDRDQARGRAQRHLEGGLGRRPPRGARRSQPRRSAAARPSPRCSPRRRSSRPPRTRPSASAPWA